MTAQFRTKDSRKHRVSVLRSLKTRTKRIAHHARRHHEILTEQGDVLNLRPDRICWNCKRTENVLAQASAAIKQALDMQKTSQSRAGSR